MLTLFFQPELIDNWQAASKCDTESFARFFWGMADRGVYLPCSQYEAIFVSAAHTAEDIEQTILKNFSGRQHLVHNLSPTPIGAHRQHGHVDSLLVAAGSSAATLGAPSSPGVTTGTTRDTLVLEYNDVEALEQAFATRGSDIAGVIFEPVVGNMGVV